MLVKCHMFKVWYFFSTGGLLQGWCFAREVVFSHPEVFAHKLLLRTEMFKHKKKSAQTLFQTEMLTHRNLCTHTHANVYAQIFLHTEPFTHKLLHAQFYTVHRRTFTHRSFYTEKSWHRGVFRQRICYTKKSLYTKKPLRTKTVTRKSFYTEVYTETFTYKATIRFTRGNFYTETNLATDQLCDNCKMNSILFLTCDHHVVRNSCIWGFKLAILLPFLIFDHDFVRKGCIWNFEIAILPLCLTFGSFCAKRLCPTWEMSMFRWFFLHQTISFHVNATERCIWHFKTAMFTVYVPIS